jgi:hypothetical protein
MKTSNTFVSLAIIFIFSTCSALADEQFEVNTSRPGSSYRHFELSEADPALCKKACEEEAQCEAWTYVKPGFQGAKSVCWLKDSAPTAQQNICCVSGVTKNYEIAAEQWESAAQMAMESAAYVAPSQMMSARIVLSPIAHVWEYLSQFGHEPEGYAAYSYILTGRDGSDKYAELMEKIQESTPTAQEVAESKTFLPDELNIFLIPAINTEGSAYKADYETSKNLLAVLGARSKLSFDRPGPFIITLYQPISSIPRRGAGEIDMLYVDLTNVSKGAVAELVRTYKNAVLEEKLDGIQKLKSLRLAILNLAFMTEDSLGFAKTAYAAVQPVIGK